MRPRFPFPRSQAASRSGVALIVTIIMISVITFLTVAFLALSGREKNSVKTATNQTTARLGADHALVRAQNEVLTGILVTRNSSAFDLLVSTNYINYGYYFNGLASPTNVNYELAGADYQQNIANLLYDPRPPVFLTNRLGGSNEFRYYLDLNRNRRHDLTGIWPELNRLGNPITNPTNTSLTNFISVIGDPEWIGVLERPNQPHSASNRFTFRYAYAVVPEGKTLDANFIHNDAKLSVNVNGYFRNQGVGTWELNLAAFLYDLNTNLWSYTSYDPNTGNNSVGTAFDDAFAFWRWRNGAAGQASVLNLFGLNGVAAFNNDFADGYTTGPLLTSVLGNTVDPDAANTTVNLNWPGADTENRYFSVQDFFDPAKTRIGGVTYGFPDRIYDAGTSNSTYDAYTYYRLLAQLGTASTAEDPDKLNLNYKNVNGFAATNFVAWDNPLEFFTNAANRLLLNYSEEWLASDYSVYTNLFRMDRTFGVTNIPVIISNQWVYSSAVHRALQLAANIWETKNGASNSPTVFRPVFGFEVSGANANVYITDFVAVTTAGEMASGIANRPVVDLIAATNPAAAILDGNVLVYGAPPIVGARKGLPNFNEFASEALVSVTRKLQVRKAGSTITQTNQVFTMEVQVPTGVEFWNSYATNFTDAVSIAVTNFTSMTLTNDLGVNFTRSFVTGARTNLGSNPWRSYRAFDRRDPKSFITMMRTNVPFLPQTLYVPNQGAAGFYSTNQLVWDDSQQLIMPRWGMTISNRIHGMILGPGGRILDYVVLGNMTYVTNLTDVIADSGGLSDAAFGDNGATPPAFKQLWATNRLAGAPPGGLLTGRPGVIQQINISVGAVPREGKWNSYGKFTPNAVSGAVAEFNNFMYTLVTNGTAAVPFTPTFQFRVPLSWQANDPLVHYLAGDLYDTEASGIVTMIDPAQNTPLGQLPGLGAKNLRYQPWPFDGAATPDGYAVDMKDPLVRASDDWQFPTNVLPTIGWLGRVHRGTPWQTVYLKANDLGSTNPAAGMNGWLGNLTDAGPALRWRKQTGNRNLLEGYYYRPVTDRVLFDVFTASINDNSTRGRLNINQTNLAAWSAVFSGVVALTNTSELAPIFNSWVIEPAGVYDPLDATTWSPLVRLVNGINTLRANPYYFPAGTFNKLGDILAVPELSDQSVFLNRSTTLAQTRSLTDAAYEWLPQQTLSLLHLDEAPRFSVYAYSQALQPAPDSILVGGNFPGLCTNYAISAEVALRAVVRIEGSPDPSQTNLFLPVKKRYPPRVVVESFNYLAPE